MSLELIGLIGSICSILSFFLGFVTGKKLTMNKINRSGNVNSGNTVKQTIKGNGNTQIGKR